MRFTIEQIKSSPCGKLNPHLETINKPKQNKYRNQKIEIDDHVFDSKKEARRYVSLKTMQAFGKISDLQLQVPFRLSACVYRADFVYKNEIGETVIEDVKSPASRTALYKLKRKMML